MDAIDNSTIMTDTTKATATSNSILGPDMAVPEYLGTNMQGAQDAIDKASGMEYQGSEYEQTVKDLLEKIGSSQYQSQYGDDIAKALSDFQNNVNFQYNPNTDANLKLAQDKAQQRVMEQMASQGIMPSTMTGERVAQSVAELQPQFEQQAFQRWQGTMDQKYRLLNSLATLDEMDYTRYSDSINKDFKLADYYNDLAKQDYTRFVDEVNSLYKQAELLIRIDDSEYTRYIDAIDRNYTKQMDTFKIQQTELENKRNETLDAWTRVEQLGYVDNKSAEILGVEAGTLSKGAREAKQKLEDELTLMEQKLKNEKELMDKEYAQSKALIGMRSSSSGSSTKKVDPIEDAWAKATNEQKQRYNIVLNAISSPLHNSIGGDPLKMMNHVIARKKGLVEQMGEGLYNAMVAEIQNRINEKSSSKGEAPVQETSGRSEKDIADTAMTIMNKSTGGSSSAINYINNSDLSDSAKSRILKQLGLGTSSSNTSSSSGSSDSGALYTLKNAPKSLLDIVNSSKLSDSEIDKALSAQGFRFDPATNSFYRK